MSSSDYMPDDSPDVTDPDEVMGWTGRDRWNAIYTVTLGELIGRGVFDWDSTELSWADAAYDAEQYKRVCEYFIERFRFREISIEPYLEWAYMLRRRLRFELMPKYKALYKLAAEGIDLAQDSDSYHKERVIGSDYPETLLSGNSDYITTGQDREFEDVKRGNIVDAYSKYLEAFTPVDEALLDELEGMFIGLYSVTIGGM